MSLDLRGDEVFIRFKLSLAQKSILCFLTKIFIGDLLFITLSRVSKTETRSRWNNNETEMLKCNTFFVVNWVEILFRQRFMLKSAIWWVIRYRYWKYLNGWSRGMLKPVLVGFCRFFRCILRDVLLGNLKLLIFPFYPYFARFFLPEIHLPPKFRFIK